MALEDTCFNWTGRWGHESHVFIIGDWGGVVTPSSSPKVQPADHRDPRFLHTRQFVVGVDDWAQQRVAEQMRLRAAVSRPDYVLNVGDNFYWGGVGSPGHYGQGEGQTCGNLSFAASSLSGQWQAVFESIYFGDGLDGPQWLGVLGNHDYGGYMFTAAWDQAIGYTWVQDSSRRWMTPAQYWSAKVWYPDFSVDYFFVDSNHLDAYEGANASPGQNLCSWHNKPDARCVPSGPESIEDCPGWFHRLWEEQFLWLSQRLDASTAEWQIVVTHFPAMFMPANWTYLSKKYGIDIIISGHTHNQRVVYLEDNVLNDTAIVISGGGGGITCEGVPDINGDDDQYGFMDMTLTRREVIVEAISHGGKLRGATRIRQRFPEVVLEAGQTRLWTVERDVDSSVHELLDSAAASLR